MADIASQILPYDIAAKPQKRADAAPREAVSDERFERELDTASRREDRTEAREARSRDTDAREARTREAEPHEPRTQEREPAREAQRPSNPDERPHNTETAERNCPCPERRDAAAEATPVAQETPPGHADGDIDAGASGQDIAVTLPAPPVTVVASDGAENAGEAVPLQADAGIDPDPNAANDNTAADLDTDTDPIIPGDLVPEGAGELAGAATDGAQTQEGTALATAQDGRAPTQSDAGQTAARQTAVGQSAAATMNGRDATARGGPAAPPAAGDAPLTADAGSDVDPGSEFARKSRTDTPRAETGDTAQNGPSRPAPSIQPTAAAGTATVVDTAAPGGAPSATTDALSTTLPTAQNASAVSVRVGVSPQTGQPVHLPANTIAFAIARNAENGVNRFQIRIDPPELGRVDVRLDMTVEGRAQAHLTVERPETLDLLQRDARALERALADAGLNVDKDSLKFSLKDQDGSAPESNGGEDGAPSGLKGQAEEDEIDPALVHHAMRGYITDTAVDISV